MNETALVQKVGNYAHVLRDQGVPNQAYISQISYLLLLKMAVSYSCVGSNDGLAAATTAEALVRVPALQVNSATRGISSGVAIAVVYSIIVRRLQHTALRLT